MDFEKPQWTEIISFLMQLAPKITQERKSIDTIISIGRGGYCPSRILADILNIHTIYNINVGYYVDKKEKKRAPAITQPLGVKLKGKHVLICDDVSDSGDSLMLVKNHLEKLGCASITTLTIYIKKWTKLIPDYYAKETEAWIIFPWEHIETLDKLNTIFTNEGLSQDEIKAKFLSIGFDQISIDFYFNNRTQAKTTQPSA
jgi:hypoxanthine phosphoribosyltransferase